MVLQGITSWRAMSFGQDPPAPQFSHVTGIVSLSLTLAQAVHQARNKKQFNGMTLPLKNLVGHFDIPLARVHRSTSPHIS